MVGTIGVEQQTRIIGLPQHMSKAATAGLDGKIDQALAAKPDWIALDVSNLQSIDSASLTWLLATQNRLTTQGVQLLLRNPSIVCLDVFLATRLDHQFKVVTGDAAGEASHA